MALRSPDQGVDPLDRAAEQLRQETPTGWIDISATVRARMRVATRHARPVAADTTDLPGRAAGTVQISDQVIAGALRQALDRLPYLQPERLRLTLDGDRCTGVSIDLAAAYGQHLPTLANRAAQTAARTLTDLLGAAAPPAGRIRVHISDLLDDPPTG